tara:strand:+ start:1921 stop:3186 length:1266 start_codon:yes stop_codon:yes gene_type:complete
MIIKRTVFISLTFLAFQCATFARAAVIDRVVGRVNDAIITLSEVEEKGKMIRMSWSQFDSSTSPPSEKEVMKQALEILVEERLLIDESKRLEMLVSDDKVKQAVEDIKKQNNVNDEILEKMLARDGMTLEQYKNKIRDQIMMSQVRKFKMRGKVNISEHRLRKYYLSNKNKFMSSPKVHVRHILFLMPKKITEGERITKSEKANEVVRKLEQGISFEALAKLYSEDESASVGGDLGAMERGKMVKEFEEVAFKLKEGEVSPIVRTPYGLHIIKVDKIIKSRPQSFDKIRNRIEAFLYNNETKKKYGQWIKELKESAYIETMLFENLQSKRDSFQRTARLNKIRNSSRNDIEKKSAKKYKLFKDKPESIRKFDLFLEDKEEKSGLEVESMEKQLRYIKVLKDRDIITEQEYERRKSEIIDQL